MHNRRVLLGVFCITQLRAQELGPGQLLVARPDLPDENFAETVVLITRSDNKRVMSLITQVLPETLWKRLAKKSQLQFV